VGVSLDGIGAANDRFRGVDGAYEQAIAGLRAARTAGLKVGLRFTITSRNAAQLDAIFDLLEQEHIPRVCFYHLVYAGRGKNLQSEDLDHAATRAVMDRIIDRTADLHRSGLPKEVLTVDNHADGPYLYLRMLRERHPRAGAAMELLRASGGNSSGVGIGCVSWDGSVHADPFWRHVSLGNVTRRPFSRIWADPSQPLLAALRDRRRHLRGRCARCQFLDMCGGNFRVRAEAATGDVWGDDPACYLSDEEIGPSP
jgi:radical SAM protein with 4Fe4S-binding SPASM domain